MSHCISPPSGSPDGSGDESLHDRQNDQMQPVPRNDFIERF
jgi:hypothetical protein